MQTGSNPSAAGRRAFPARSDSSPDSSVSFRLRPQAQRQRTWPVIQNVPQPFPATEKPPEPSSRGLWFRQYPASGRLLRPPHDTSRLRHASPAQAGMRWLKMTKVDGKLSYSPTTVCIPPHRSRRANSHKSNAKVKLVRILHRHRFTLQHRQGRWRLVHDNSMQPDVLRGGAYQNSVNTACDVPRVRRHIIVSQ